jgi:hypothetical protein
MLLELSFQNYWGFLDFVHLPVFREHNVSETGSVSILR